MDIEKFIQEQRYNLDNQISDYERMISSWINTVEKSILNKKEQKKRILELCHLASFSIALKNKGIIKDIREINLVELSVNPDFIILYKNQRLGLEIRRVFNSRAKEIGEKRSFLNSVERYFKKKYPNLKVLVNISIDDSFDVSTLNNDFIRNQTADFIYSQIMGGQIEKPAFITRARSMIHSHLTFNLTGYYCVGSLDEEIKQGIIEKDKKLKNYKTKMNLEKVWLLLVVSGAAPDSHFSHFDENTFVCDNSFDSVFLLNDFEKNIYFLTQNWNKDVSN